MRIYQVEVSFVMDGETDTFTVIAACRSEEEAKDKALTRIEERYGSYPDEVTGIVVKVA